MSGLGPACSPTYTFRAGYVKMPCIQRVVPDLAGPAWQIAGFRFFIRLHGS